MKASVLPAGLTKSSHAAAHFIDSFHFLCMLSEVHDIFHRSSLKKNLCDQPTPVHSVLALSISFFSCELSCPFGTISEKQEIEFSLRSC